MKPSTGKYYHAAKASEFSFYKKKYEVFKLKRESKRYKFIKAIQPIYQNYLVKVAVQPRTSTEMIQYVIFAYSTLLVSKVDTFETF